MIFKWFVLAMFFCAIYSFSEFLWININDPLIGIVNGREIRASYFKQHDFEKKSLKEIKEHFHAIAEKYVLSDQAKRSQTDVDGLFLFFDRVRDFEITKKEYDIKRQKWGLKDKNISSELKNKIKEEIYLERLSRAKENYIEQIKKRSVVKFLAEK